MTESLYQRPSIVDRARGLATGKRITVISQHHKQAIITLIEHKQV